AHRLEDAAVLPHAVTEPLGDAALAHWLDYAEAHASSTPADMDALEAEAPGLLGALVWAYTHERWKPLLGLVHAVDWSWALRGRQAEEARYLPWAVEAATREGDLSEQQFMRHALAVHDFQQGRMPQALAGYREALRLAKTLGDKSAIRAETHALAVLDAR